ncbi:hypothetical protein B0H14DRAFT_3506469 [Mycena olivaceomarginata]|nr:hypothetical protein B0H14DRAFT_3506469 [Mycena olivaceomarginata]
MASVQDRRWCHTLPLMVVIFALRLLRDDPKTPPTRHDSPGIPATGATAGVYIELKWSRGSTVSPMYFPFSTGVTRHHTGQLVCYVGPQLDHPLLRCRYLAPPAGSSDDRLHVLSAIPADLRPSLRIYLLKFLPNVICAGVESDILIPLELCDMPPRQLMRKHNPPEKTKRPEGSNNIDTTSSYDSLFLLKPQFVCVRWVSPRKSQYWMNVHLRIDVKSLTQAQPELASVLMDPQDSTIAIGGELDCF